MNVVEKHYSPTELEALLGFGPRFWRDLAKAGELTLVVNDAVIAEPKMISGELRIPASAVNAYLARHPFNRPVLGIAARSEGELRRKLAAAA